MILEQELGIVAMEPMGEYDNTIKYEKLNIVTYKGSSYCALGDTLGNDPTNDEYWQLIVKKGDKGDTYELTDEDKENIKNDITENANSDFNKNVESKTNTFNDNVTEKTSSFNTNVENKTKEFNNNSTTKLEEFNTNSTNKLEEYNTNANAKLNEYNANADGVMTIAVDTRNELERVKNDVLETGEASGNYLTLNDSTMAELQELEVASNEVQETSTGKNLFDYTKISKNASADGIIATLNDNGSVTIKGIPASNYTNVITYTDITDILEDGETYIISQSNANKYFYIQVVENNQTSGTSNFISLMDGIASRSFIVDKTKNKYSITAQTGMLSIWGTSSREITNFFQLEKGSVATTFEKYTNRVASPSPDYPQEIPMITTDRVLKSTGKNLFDKDKISEGYRLGSDGLPFYAAEFWSSDFIKVKPNTKYTYSRPAMITGHMTCICCYDENKNHIERQIISDNISIYNITTSSNVKYVKIADYNEALDLSQFKESATATEYEPYQESILNLPIPENEFVGYINDNVKDKLRVSYNEEDGNYHLYLDKMLGKVVLNENNDFTKSTNSTTGDVFFKNSAIESLVKKWGKVISNYFINNDKSYNDTSITNAFALGGSGYTLIFKIKDITTVDDFKNWLSTHNVEVVYELNTPYTLDLGIVDMPLSYDGVTNIFVDTDLLMNINTKYYRNFTETVRNLQINNDTLKNELINIESRLTALENAQVSIVNESEVVE